MQTFCLDDNTYYIFISYMVGSLRSNWNFLGGNKKLYKYSRSKKKTINNAIMLKRI